MRDDAGDNATATRTHFFCTRAGGRGRGRAAARVGTERRDEPRKARKQAQPRRARPCSEETIHGRHPHILWVTGFLPRHLAVDKLRSLRGKLRVRLQVPRARPSIVHRNSAVPSPARSHFGMMFHATAPRPDAPREMHSRPARRLRGTRAAQGGPPGNSHAHARSRAGLCARSRMARSSRKRSLRPAENPRQVRAKWGRPRLRRAIGAAITRAGIAA